MAFSSSNVKFQRKVSIQNATKVTRGGFQIFDPAAPTSSDGTDGAVLIATGTSGDYYTLKRGATAGSAASYQRGIARFSGIISITNNTTGTLTLPASLSGLDIATQPIFVGLATNDGAAQSAVQISVSGTTLTATLGTTTGAGKTMHVTVYIP